MRVVLVGRSAARSRLRRQASSPSSDLVVVGEAETLAAAKALDVDADGFLVAPDEGSGNDVVVDGLLSEPLTAREMDVLELLAEGLPNKAIAARLAISDQTVKFHVASISGKLGAANRTDAVRLAIRRGIVTV